MPNTFDSSLVADSISAQTKTILAKRLAPLSLFASDYSSDVKKPGETVLVGIATAGSTTQVNPTTFNSIGGSTVGKASVTLQHIYQPFGLSYEDMKNGHRLDRIAKVNADALADKIWALVTTPITVANFGAATVTSAPNTVTATSGDLPKVWAAVHKSARKGLVVSPEVYSQLIPTSSQALNLGEGAYGFENGVHYASAFSGESGLYGFACSEDALVMAAAAPALNSNSYEVQNIVLEQLGGLTVTFTMHHDTSVRSDIATLEVMFGAAPGLTAGTMALMVD